MSIITIFSGSFCHADDIAREVIARTSHRLITDAEIVAAGRRAEEAGQDGDDEETEGEQHQHGLKEA